MWSFTPCTEWNKKCCSKAKICPIPDNFLNEHMLKKIVYWRSITSIQMYSTQAYQLLTGLSQFINKLCNWLSLFAFLADKHFLDGLLWKLVTFQSVSGSQVRGSQSEGSRHIYGETGLKGTGDKVACFSQKMNRRPAWSPKMREIWIILNTDMCKASLEESQNQNLDLKINTIGPF